MEVAGLPLHPLVVHAVVVLVPLAVLSALAQLALPGWRWLTRWSTLVLGGGALPTVVVARASGSALLEERPLLLEPGTQIREQMLRHQDLANYFTTAFVVFLVVVVAAFVLLPAPTGLASGALDHRGSGNRTVVRVCSALLALAALATLALVVLTGDAGARAVWG